MRILITGGAGFIGSHLARFHLERGDEVHVVDDLSTGSTENVASLVANPAFRFTEADIVEWEGLARAVSGADRVYHLAAVVGMFRVLAEPDRVFEVNVLGTERVLRTAAEGGGSRRVLVASSSEVYGPRGDSRFTDLDFLSEGEDLFLPADAGTRAPYPMSKLASEALSRAYAMGRGLPVVIARLFNTVGPGQTGRYGMVLPRFVEQALSNAPITVFGDGRQTRSFCDVRDTVRALHGLLEAPAAAGPVVNVGNDRPITILGLARLVRERAGSESPFRFVPMEEAYGAGFVPIVHRRPSLSRLRSLIHFEHRYTLEETVDRVIAEARAEVPVVA